MASAIAIFCGKSKEHILRDGGTQSWRLLPRNAVQHEYVVCCRSGVDWVEGPEKRGSAFLIGRISGVVPSTDNNAEDRYLVKISEYAELDLPEVWQGWRNPVKYTTLEELGVSLEGLDFKSMPPTPPVSKGAFESLVGSSGRDAQLHDMLTIAQAKKALAATYGVPVDAIKITIHG